MAELTMGSPQIHYCPFAASTQTLVLIRSTTFELQFHDKHGKQGNCFLLANASMSLTYKRHNFLKDTLEQFHSVSF